MKISKEAKNEVRKYKEKFLEAVTDITANPEALYIDMELLFNKILESNKEISREELLDFFDEELMYFKKYKLAQEEEEFAFNVFLIKCLTGKI